MQIIYIDVLFLLNFIVDFFIFKIALLLMSREATIKKSIIASSLAAMLCCMPLILRPLQQLPYLIYYLYTPIISILYLFKPRNCKQFIKIYGLCLGVASVIGGVIFNIYFVLSRYIQTITISITFITLGAFIIYMIVSQSIIEIRKQKIKYKFEYELEISLDEGKLNLKAFLDTGNQLYTLDKKPVLMAHYESVQSILSEKQKEFIARSKYEDVLALTLDKAYEGMDINLIPYCGVGCKGDLLIGLPIKELKVHSEGGGNGLKNAVMGITFNPFFNSNTYQVLLHPEMVEI